MKKKAAKEVIKDFIAIHGKKYDYSHVQYINSRIPVEIICPIHGVFKQAPYNHRRGTNCPRCVGKKRYTTEEIISEFKKIHGNKYDYSLVNYINTYTPVIITCPTHGTFMQCPSEHKRGGGCPQCARKRKLKQIKPLTRSEIMSRVKSKDTIIEVLLRKALWKKGLRYRKNDHSVFGSPDIVFKGKKIAIFCDSEFWHGKLYEKGKIPTNNQEYWIKKFKKNIARDIEVNKQLNASGWTVLRFWETDIKKDLDSIVQTIIRYF